MTMHVCKVRPLSQCALVLAILGSCLSFSARGQEVPPARPGDRMIAAYFRAETQRIAAHALGDVQSLEQWQQRRVELRDQLFEMLGLSPLPSRSDLKATITGTLEHEDFTVEKLHFQSMPGLYVTGNVYIPKHTKFPAPAVLYVCGHGQTKIDGVAYGTKVTYQHHPAWFARNGYVCLIIDTLQLGEIEGLHHGTYREGMWWWNARGYTPAGVEAWNSLRAVDYLQSRAEVDPNRIGVTGRSGGGAYSWWLAALDERVGCVVPVAGITDLQNYVVDGAVEGHCDCMFMVNTYAWDFPMVAALVAPRPLLISNSDKDSIFPLDGVVRTYFAVQKIYRLYDAEDKLGLLITEGPHRDTQQLRVPAFHWMNRWLKGEDPLVDDDALKPFSAQQLKVFDELPRDQRNTRIHEDFVLQQAPQLPENARQWAEQRQRWMEVLQSKVFRGWRPAEPLDLQRCFTLGRQGVELSAYDFRSEHDVPLRLYLARAAGQTAPQRVRLDVLDEDGWHQWLAAVSAAFGDVLTAERTLDDVVADTDAFTSLRKLLGSDSAVLAYVAPRGVGLTAWQPSKETHIRRRFVLLGKTLDGQCVWDVRRAVEAVRQLHGVDELPITLAGSGQAASLALYASLFEPAVDRLRLEGLAASHRDTPTLLHVLRYFDVPQAVALAMTTPIDGAAAAFRSVTLIEPNAAATDVWTWPQQLRERLALDRPALTVEFLPASE